MFEYLFKLTTEYSQILIFPFYLLLFANVIRNPTHTYCKKKERFLKKYFLMAILFPKKKYNKFSAFIYKNRWIVNKRIITSETQRNLISIL